MAATSMVQYTGDGHLQAGVHECQDVGHIVSSPAPGNPAPSSGLSAETPVAGYIHTACNVKCLTVPGSAVVIWAIGQGLKRTGYSKY